MGCIPSLGDAVKTVADPLLPEEVATMAGLGVDLAAGNYVGAADLAVDLVEPADDPRRAQAGQSPSGRDAQAATVVAALRLTASLRTPA